MEHMNGHVLLFVYQCQSRTCLFVHLTKFSLCLDDHYEEFYKCLSKCYEYEELAFQGMQEYSMARCSLNCQKDFSISGSFLHPFSG